MAFTDYTSPAVDAVTGVVAPASLWNTYVRDNGRVAAPHRIALTTSDQIVNNSTTYVDVTGHGDAMALPVAANEAWLLWWMIRWNSGTTPDIKFAWTFPTGGSLAADLVYLDAVSAVSHQSLGTTTSPTSDFTAAGGTQDKLLPLPMHYVNGANAGSLQLRMAQFTANASNTIVRTNSTLWGVKLA
jgi:hypothetical protein